MSIPSVAKSNATEHLTALADLEPGKAVHYCIVRLAGPKDDNVRAVFGDSMTQATPAAFEKLWKTDDTADLSKSEEWIVARGVFLGAPDGVRTLPAARGNRVTGKAAIKDTLKDLKASLKAGSVPSGSLQKAIDGKIGTMAEYTEWARKSGVEPQELGDAADMGDASADTKSDRVVALVARYKKVALKEALTAQGKAITDKEKDAAKLALEAIAKELADIDDLRSAARKTLEGRVLGKTRYKDSLATLEELATRVRFAQNSVQKALNASLDGADLEGGTHGIDDTILATLRGLLAQLKSAPPEAKIKILSDIYFGADYWLKAAGVGSGGRQLSDTVDLEMKSQVEEFYSKAATALAKEAKVSINVLPAWLEKNHGKGMEAHGTKLDVGRGLAKWMDADARDIFRVHVKGGKLYQYPWWEWGSAEDMIMLGEMKLVPADSSKYPSDQISAGFSGFVLSMGGDLFMTHQHAVAQRDGDQASVFHSSYMAGLPIRMAGELMVSGGRVKVVNARSGHYRPPPAMVVGFLKHMSMLGVKVDAVQPDPGKDDKFTVDAFLKMHGSKEPSPVDYEANDQAMVKYKQELFFAALVKQQQALLTKLTPRVASLEQANTALLDLRIQVARGKATQMMLSHRPGFEDAQRKAMDSLQPHMVPLTKSIAELGEKLDAREKNHAELVKKDQTPIVDRIDGYVKTLTEMRDKLNVLRVGAEAAIEEALNPRPVVLPTPKVDVPKARDEVEAEESQKGKSSPPDEPVVKVHPLVAQYSSHPAYHDELDSAGAERLLAQVDESAWLLRLSVNKGNLLAVSASVVTTGSSEPTRTFIHGIVGSRDISLEQFKKRYLDHPEQMILG